MTTRIATAGGDDNLPFGSWTVDFAAAFDAFAAVLTAVTPVTRSG